MTRQTAGETLGSTLPCQREIRQEPAAPGRGRLARRAAKMAALHSKTRAHPNTRCKYSMLFPAMTCGPSSNLNTSTDT